MAVIFYLIGYAANEADTREKSREIHDLKTENQYLRANIVFLTEQKRKEYLEKEIETNDDDKPVIN